MTNTVNSDTQVFEKRLRSLGKYIRDLYLIGGIPLVLIGIGAATLFIPYAAETRMVITIALFGVGAVSWGASTYIAVFRWRTEIEVAAKQDELVLSAICEIAKNETSDAVTKKIDALKDSLSELGVRWVRTARSEEDKQPKKEAPAA